MINLGGICLEAGRQGDHCNNQAKLRLVEEGKGTDSVVIQQDESLEPGVFWNKQEGCRMIPRVLASFSNIYAYIYIYIYIYMCISI